MSISDLQQQLIAATIANGATTSGDVTIPFGHSLVAIDTPSALTGTSMTFKASVDGANWDDVYYEGTQYSVTVGTSRWIALDPRVFCAVRLMRLVSGSSEGEARTIQCVIRPIH